MSDFSEKFGTPEELKKRVIGSYVEVLKGDPLNTEKNGQKNMELVAGCMDTILVASKGEYWDKLPTVGIEFPDDESVSKGLRGAHAEIIPLLKPTEEQDGKFIMGIREKGSNDIMSQHLYMEVSLTDLGHEVVEGRYSLKDESEVTVQDLYTALTGISLATLSNLQK